MLYYDKAWGVCHKPATNYGSEKEGIVESEEQAPDFVSQTSTATWNLGLSSPARRPSRPRPRSLRCQNGGPQSWHTLSQRFSGNQTSGNQESNLLWYRLMEATSQARPHNVQHPKIVDGDRMISLLTTSGKPISG